MNHPNIVKLYEVYEIEDQVVLILEHLKGGDLLDRLRKKKKYSEESGAKLFKNLLEILLYLEENEFVHRDIKLNNIIMVDENDDISIKLADFGLSVSTQTTKCNEFIGGTPGYFAPEVFDDFKASHKTDVYSAGIILFML